MEQPRLKSIQPNSTTPRFTLYNLGEQLVPKVLLDVFREFHRPLVCTTADMLSMQAKGTFIKHFTKHWEQAAAPDYRSHKKCLGSSAGTWTVLKKMMATRTVRRALFLGCMLQLIQQVSLCD